MEGHVRASLGQRVDDLVRVRVRGRGRGRVRVRVRVRDSALMTLPSTRREELMPTASWPGLGLGLGDRARVRIRIRVRLRLKLRGS